MAEPTRVLRRLPDQGQIAGVCAGLARYLDIDVTLMRVAFVILAVITGGGMVLVYLVLALVMPPERAVAKTEKADAGKHDIGHNASELAAEMRESGRSDQLRNYVGVGLVLLGVWFLLEQLFPRWLAFRWDYLWPVVLIVIGIFIATRRNA